MRVRRRTTWRTSQAEIMRHPELKLESSNASQRKIEIKQMMALGEKFGPDNRAELDEENERQIGQSAAAEKATANKDFMKMAKDETEADNSRDVTPDQAELENKVRAAMLNTPPKMGTFAGLFDQIGAQTRGTKASCSIDWNLACPQGWEWKTVDERKLCVAPKDYGGDCNTQLDLAGFTDEQKAAVARVCSAPFPCQGPCHQDYTQQCPLNWNEDGATKCKAGPDYDGPCSKEIDTSMWSDEEKFAFGVQCGAVWRCKAGGVGDNHLSADCRRDYRPNCPIKWLEQRPGFCVANPDYQGPCKREIDVSNWGVPEKRSFAHGCGANWPCASPDRAVPHTPLPALKPSNVPFPRGSKPLTNLSCREI
eukprot:GEMP01049742.1.p1 GENE.GEMP01049742.1~~GEMP01049742.1.p1  ORF type:complete len:366 (+),score=70.01 GEMP01049742.1:419-1516(+)